MSAKATFWAWEQEISNATHKIILLCLSDCHNADTGQCNPSIDYIARKTGCNRKTVIKAIKQFIEDDLICVVKNIGTSNRYRLNIERRNEQQDLHNTSTISGTTNKGTTNSGPAQQRDYTSTNKGTTPVPMVGHKPKKNLKRTLKDFIPPGNLNLVAWEEWVSYRKDKNKTISFSAANKQAKLLISYSPELQQEIVDSSIRNDYQGLFAPKGDSNATTKRLSAQERKSERLKSVYNYEQATNF